jgi:hypothetical protein
MGILDQQTIILGEGLNWKSVFIKLKLIKMITQVPILLSGGKR